MKILVTGATGFIGRAVCTEAHRQGLAVDALVRNEKSASHTPLGARAIAADLTDPQALAAAIAPSDYDAVIHLAGHVVRGFGPSAISASLAGVMGLTLPLLATLAQHSPHTRVIVVTSAARYGLSAQDGVLREDATCQPIDAYGLAKAQLSQVLDLLAARDGLKLIEAIPFNVIGKGQPADLVPSAFCQQIAALAGPGAIEVGATSPVRDFLDVTDVARALLILAHRGEPSRRYNIASGTGHSIEDLLRRLLSLSRTPFTFRQTAARQTPWDLPSVVGANEALRALGWAPKVSLDDSLRANLSDQGVALKTEPTVSGSTESRDIHAT